MPKTGAPVVAACDYVSAVADLIRPWIADPYLALGTDGFGRSDTRARLRRFFEVDRHAVAVAALHALGDSRVAEAISRYGGLAVRHAAGDHALEHRPQRLRNEVVPIQPAGARVEAPRDREMRITVHDRPQGEEGDPRFAR